MYALASSLWSGRTKLQGCTCTCTPTLVLLPMFQTFHNISKPVFWKDVFYETPYIPPLESKAMHVCAGNYNAWLNNDIVKTKF